MPRDANPIDCYRDEAGASGCVEAGRAGTRIKPVSTGSIVLLLCCKADPGVEVASREGRPAELATWLGADALDAAILNPVDAPAEGWRTEPLYTER